MAFGDRPKNCPPQIDAVDWNGEEGHRPSDEPFPYTPEEAWWVLQGYAVRPASGPITVEIWRKLVYRRWELVDGWLAPSS